MRTLAAVISVLCAASAFGQNKDYDGVCEPMGPCKIWRIQDPAGITRNMQKQRVLLHHESTRFPFVVISENVRALDGAWVKALETYVIRPDRLECVQPDRRMVFVQTDSGALSIDCIEPEDTP